MLKHLPGFAALARNTPRCGELSFASELGDLRTKRVDYGVPRMRIAKMLLPVIAMALGLAMLWPSAGAAEETPATFEGHTAAVNALAYGPDGKTLASGSADKSVK